MAKIDIEKEIEKEAAELAKCFNHPLCPSKYSIITDLKRQYKNKKNIDEYDIAYKIYDRAIEIHNSKKEG